MNAKRRAKRVPYEKALELVGERALTEATTERTLRYDWRDRGVPPEKFCWTLIEAVDRGKIALPRTEPAVIEEVRAIAARTKMRGPLWDAFVNAVRNAARLVREIGNTRL